MTDEIKEIKWDMEKPINPKNFDFKTKMKLKSLLRDTIYERLEQVKADEIGDVGDDRMWVEFAFKYLEMLKSQRID